MLADIYDLGEDGTYNELLDVLDLLRHFGGICCFGFAQAVVKLLIQDDFRSVGDLSANQSPAADEILDRA